MVCLVVAEPNPLLRIGVRSVLENHPAIVIADEVDDGAGLLAAFQHGRADVALVGLGLLRQLGPAALRELRPDGAACRVLAHSYEWDRDFGAEAARFGAAGYVSRDCSRTELCTAVLEVAAGRPFVTPDLCVALAEAACFRAAARACTPLSEREGHVFRMLAIGLGVRQIAAQLGMRVQDAVECKWRIAAKMDLTASGELVRYAVARATRLWPRPESARVSSA